jgi:hypothetical protein
MLPCEYDGGRVIYILPPHLCDYDRIVMAMGGDVAELLKCKRRWAGGIGAVEDEQLWRSFVAHLRPQTQR